jgi:hypothetical protein
VTHGLSVIRPLAFRDFGSVRVDLVNQEVELQVEFKLFGFAISIRDWHKLVPILDELFSLTLIKILQQQGQGSLLFRHGLSKICFERFKSSQIVTSKKIILNDVVKFFLQLILVLC